MKKWTRRAALTGAGTLALGGGLIAFFREGDRGGSHSRYFADLSAALRRAGIAQPALVIDTQRLQHNIEAARATLKDTSLNLRVVVKSLPAIQLIEKVASGLNTQRYMVFNGAMLAEMALRKPYSDLLLGKPLPVTAAEQFYKRMLQTQAPFAEPQWLIDTEERLRQYASLAQSLNRTLSLNLEIDVGLHRGGFENERAVYSVLALARQTHRIKMKGLMGYDAHVPKVPGPESAYRDSQQKYRAAVQVITNELNTPVLTFNAAGSPTYALHAKGTVANEVSVGSAFLKPADFDLDTLDHHVPAAYIATPVLKALSRSDVPALEILTKARALLDANTERAFFIHGGHWLAKPESPPGLQYSELYGRSSNQELLTGSSSIALKPDDFVFLRPTQSEAVLLQFGALLAYDGQEIVDRWPTFDVSA